jgi:hypothetical protein
MTQQFVRTGVGHEQPGAARGDDRAERGDADAR